MFVYKQSGCVTCSHLNFAPASSMEFLDIHATIECRFTLKRERDMIRTYSQFEGSIIIRMEPSGTSALYRYSWEDSPSRSTGSRLLLRQDTRSPNN